MRKLKYFNGKWFYEKIGRKTNGEVLSFSTWLSALAEATELPALTTYNLNRLFCRYQCECARLGIEFESPTMYGLKGLFG